MMFIVNVEGAIRKDNKWVILQRSNKEQHAGGFISLVGGKVEDVHMPFILENTLRREIAEETGIEVHEEMRYLHSISFQTEQGETVVDVIFLCHYKCGELRITDPDEVESIYLLTTEEILQHELALDYLKTYIQMAEHTLKQED